jgi:hypothetical protein
VTRHLQVLISPTCAGCARARTLASEIAERRPDLLVEVIDVDAPGWQPPAVFSGTPMYLLDGEVVSYGNPRLADLEAAVARSGRA